jgi:predicted RNA-binding protein YlxR (DUF448 family)
MGRPHKSRHPGEPATAGVSKDARSRERRDIVSGEVRPESRLIRFASAPDGTVVPDLARKLPGRGVWVAADRASIETAVAKNLFSRAAKARLSAPRDLADQVEQQLRTRLLSALGLARKAGDLTFGFERVLAAIRAGKTAWLVEASDGSLDGRRKLLAAARALDPPPGVLTIFTAAELSLALGVGNVIHTAFLAGRGAERWTSDVERLSGFRPLLP